MHHIEGLARERSYLDLQGRCICWDAAPGAECHLPLLQGYRPGYRQVLCSPARQTVASHEMCACPCTNDTGRLAVAMWVPVRSSFACRTARGVSGTCGSAGSGARSAGAHAHAQAPQQGGLAGQRCGSARPDDRHHAAAEAAEACGGVQAELHCPHFVWRGGAVVDGTISAHGLRSRCGSSMASLRTARHIVRIYTVCMRLCGALNRWACVNHGRCGSTAINMLPTLRVLRAGFGCCMQAKQRSDSQATML